MLGAKIFLTAVSGIGGLIGYTSFSIPKWDPPNIWRIRANSKFYLTTCSNRARLDGGKLENAEGSDKEWVYSDLWIYLTVKNSGEINEGSELQLWGEGSYTKFKGPKVYIPEKYGIQNLQDKLNDEGDDSKFDLTIEGESNRLGEISAGTNSQQYGDFIKCKKKLFKFEKYPTPETSIKDIKLKDVLFSLKDCGKNNYKGVKGCSIEIKSAGKQTTKQLTWNELKPIVLID